MTETPEFPIPAPEGAAEPKVDGRKRERTPEERAAFAQRMTEARARKRAEREAGGSTGQQSSKKASRSAASPKLEEIEISLTEGMTKLGAMLVLPAPVPGTYILRTGEEFAQALTRLASRNPALLRALGSTSNIMDYVAVGTWSVGMFVAVSVQTGRIPADAPAARSFGLTEIVDEFYPDLAARAAAPQIDDAPVTDGAFERFEAFEVPVPPERVTV